MLSRKHCSRDKEFLSAVTIFPDCVTRSVTDARNLVQLRDVDCTQITTNVAPDGCRLTQITTNVAPDGCRLTQISTNVAPDDGRSIQITTNVALDGCRPTQITTNVAPQITSNVAPDGYRPTQITIFRKLHFMLCRPSKQLYVLCVWVFFLAFTLYHTTLTFNNLEKEEKEKMVVRRLFFFSHNFFSPMKAMFLCCHILVRLNLLSANAFKMN